MHNGIQTMKPLEEDPSTDSRLKWRPGCGPGTIYFFTYRNNQIVAFYYFMGWAPSYPLLGSASLSMLSSTNNFETMHAPLFRFRPGLLAHWSNTSHFLSKHVTGQSRPIECATRPDAIGWFCWLQYNPEYSDLKKWRLDIIIILRP